MLIEVENGEVIPSSNISGMWFPDEKSVIDEDSLVIGLYDPIHTDSYSVDTFVVENHGRELHTLYLEGKRVGVDVLRWYDVERFAEGDKGPMIFFDEHPYINSNT